MEPNTQTAVFNGDHSLSHATDRSLNPQESNASPACCPGPPAQPQQLGPCRGACPLAQGWAMSTYWGWAAAAPLSASRSSVQPLVLSARPGGSQSGRQARSSRPGRISPLRTVSGGWGGAPRGGRLSRGGEDQPCPTHLPPSCLAGTQALWSRNQSSSIRSGTPIKLQPCPGLSLLLCDMRWFWPEPADPSLFQKSNERYRHPLPPNAHLYKIKHNLRSS